MNNFRLAFFILLLLLLIGTIHFKKGLLFVLFQEGTGNFTTQVEGETYPKILIDKTGIKFQLQQPPTRIISATLASDHILSELIDPQRLIAVSSYIDYPSLSNLVGFYSKQITRTEGEIESMLALQPDLVFIASYSNPETVRYLLRSHIPVVRISEFNSFTDIFNNIRLISNVTDSKANGEAVINQLQQRLKLINKQLENKNRPRVLYYDLNGYSVGGHSLMDETIKLAGGINAAAQILPNGENKISAEQAISLQPDVIIMNSWTFNENANGQSPLYILRNKKAWQEVPAIKNNRLYTLPGKWLRSVSQHRINGVEALAKLLHPEINLNQESHNVH
jgi:iron complex transport system substrate-binding protein